jgi:uncharacterized membrane protein
MNRETLRGYLMAIIGFIMLLINAVGYIFGFDFKSGAFTIIGLVFVTIGLKLAREDKRK